MATVYWGLSCWHNADLWLNQLHIRSFLFSSAHVNSVILHTDKCTLMLPQNGANHIVWVSPLLFLLLSPYIFQKLQPYGRGSPASNAHLEEQRYYLQLTLNFKKCIKRELRFGSGKDGGRGWTERWKDKKKKKETDEVKRGELYLFACGCMHVSVCACMHACLAALHPPKSLGRLIAFQG